MHAAPPDLARRPGSSHRFCIKPRNDLAAGQHASGRRDRLPRQRFPSAATPIPASCSPLSTPFLPCAFPGRPARQALGPCRQRITGSLRLPLSSRWLFKTALAGLGHRLQVEPAAPAGIQANVWLTNAGSAGSATFRVEIGRPQLRQPACPDHRLFADPRAERRSRRRIEESLAATVRRGVGQSAVGDREPSSGVCRAAAASRGPAGANCGGLD